LNRKGFDQAIAGAIDEVLTSGASGGQVPAGIEVVRSIGILALDIDHFKQVNDKYGHNVGDEVLKTFAQRLLGNLRSFDLVARLGGEEFAVILPDVTEQRAWMVAERLRNSIAESPFAVTHAEGQVSVTTSIGAALITHDPSTKTEALERADKCLYEAKQGGRNAVVFEGKGKLNPDDRAPTDFDAINLSAAALWRLSDGFDLRFGLDRSERAPTNEELFAGGTHVATQSIEIGDATLDTEKGVRAEIGAHWHTDRVELNPCMQAVRVVFEDVQAEVVARLDRGAH
jgi:diguanylate cyclase (GGDEF)-like protein